MENDSKRAGRHIEAGLTVPHEHHEAVCNFIIENFSSGLILEEEEGSPNVGIKFYLPEANGFAFKDKLTSYIRKLDKMTAFQSHDIRARIIRDMEWIEAYRQSIQPIDLDDITVRPPWAEAPAKSNYDIIIEPKMAFGTGSHETTKLCLREIRKHFKSGQTLFDLGCGSGILSILAATMGAVRINAVDIDPEALDNAAENTVINDVGNIISVSHGSIELAKQDPPYDFLAANIILSTISDLYENISKAVRPGGIILLSGLLLEDEPGTRKLLDREDIARYDINRDGQWLSFTVFKK